MEQQYNNLVHDDDFLRLDLDLKSANIFNVLKIQSNEIRHSNFIAWLLDPKGSHQLGDLFLKHFLREIFSSNLFPDISSIDVAEFLSKDVKIYREWRHIDILIVGNEFVVCIENKVFSKEHSNQLNRYAEIVEKEFPLQRKTYVYLTPEGSDTDEERYLPVSYEKITNILEQIISIFSASLSDHTILYLKDYIGVIKRDIMKNDDASLLAQRIYKNHQELFDFVFENKPDQVNRINNLLSEAITKRGWTLGSPGKNYVRFYTPKIKHLIYSNDEKNGWKYSECFLFEFVLKATSNAIVFKTVISPSSDNKKVEILETILKSIDGSKPAVGKKWLVNFRKSFKFDFSNADELDDEEIIQTLDDFLTKVESIVSKVEGRFLQEEKTILTLAKG